MLPGLGAVLLLASPWAAAAPPTVAEVERMEVEFSTLTRNFDADLAAIEDLRRELPHSSHPDSTLAEMGRRIGQLVYEGQAPAKLAILHSKAVENLLFLSGSRKVYSAFARSAEADADVGKVFGFRGASREMRGKMDTLFTRLDFETKAYNSVLNARARAREARRRRRIALGAFVPLAVAAAWAWRRSGEPARRAGPLFQPLLGPTAMPKTVAGNLDVLGLLGSGAMGEVYEAVDTSLNRRAALKRLSPSVMSDPAALESILREARLMAALKHPNLVAIYSVEKEAGQVFLVLEFVDGMSLQRRLDAETRLPWPEALRIARGVGAALDYAHERRVIHRDLKPSNVMLSKKGEVKVMDFGIAHQAAKSVSRLTRAPAWGTPAYMAPEQELGGVSAAVDLYSLAVCLYEMLTGELPFKGPNFLAQKRESLWTPPSRLVGGLPAGVDGVFAAALAPEPSRRFKDAAALLAACGALNS